MLCVLETRTFRIVCLFVVGEKNSGKARKPYKIIIRTYAKNEGTFV